MGKKALPHFLFVGAAKSGTTSIFHYLNQHPKIAIPIKESFYFNRAAYPEELLEYPKQRVPESICRSEEEYKSYFKDVEDGKVIGEIGTGYLLQHEIAIPEIKKTLGEDVKICIILRNPVERTFSSYMHFKRFSLDLGSLFEEIELEKEREKKAYDFMWQFTGLSMYSKQVKAYMENFNNVRVFFYEDLNENSDQLMKDILSYIGVKEELSLNTQERFNPSGEAKNPWLQKLLTHDLKIKKVLRPIYHRVFGKGRVQKFRDSIRDKNIKKVTLSHGERERLEHLFKDDVKALQEILGDRINLSKLWY